MSRGEKILMQVRAKMKRRKKKRKFRSILNKKRDDDE
jgi:hypothetical protein